MHKQQADDRERKAEQDRASDEAFKRIFAPIMDSHAENVAFNRVFEPAEPMDVTEVMEEPTGAVLAPGEDINHSAASDLSDKRKADALEAVEQSGNLLNSRFSTRNYLGE